MQENKDLNINAGKLWKDGVVTFFLKVIVSKIHKAKDALWIEYGCVCIPLWF